MGVLRAEVKDDVGFFERLGQLRLQRCGIMGAALHAASYLHDEVLAPIGWEWVDPIGTVVDKSRVPLGRG